MPQSENARPALIMPPRQTTADGRTRRVGVELEMNGITLDELASTVAGVLDLEITAQGRYERLLTGDPAGDWKVELDFRLLRDMGREPRDGGEIIDELRHSAEEILARVSEPVVPFELVSPPLPLDRLEDVERLIEHLRARGARGTTRQATNAFSLQLNPELPDLSAQSILDYIRAFSCLFPWLQRRAQVDFARRITGFAEPFPERYLRRILRPEYQPEQTALIDDYLDANPTRNRALDLLPLFAHLDHERVVDRVADPLIKARPTLHYRLPNCEIDRPDWGLHVVWNDWWQVEALACDHDRLTECCAAFLAFLDAPVDRLFGADWSTRVERSWLRAAPR
ncbi:MAG: amidoligase family protein [Halothiobacillaceae bacterium]